MSTYERAELEAAFAEYLRRGVETHDWPAWADLFTDDAEYVEHHLGRFHGRDAIKAWIVETMAGFPSMSLWVEWAQFGDDGVAFYIWNNLPDPTGEGRHFGFPNTTVLRYGGGGKWRYEADFYNPVDAERAVKEWIRAGGRRHLAPDHSMTGKPGWAPEPPTPAFPREEVEREFLAYRERGVHAVRTGDWHQWADQFTEDATYLEHHFGRFEGQQAIREWITGVMKPFPTMEFPVAWYSIEGNRVSAIIPNVLPAPEGSDGYFAFDVNTILHYAGDGKWSYEEDVYNPHEAEKVIGAWVRAGGVIPS